MPHFNIFNFLDFCFMLKSLASLLFPNYCPGCNTVLLDSEYIICTDCSHNIPYTQHYKINDNETAKKFYGRLPVQHASSLLYFNKHGIVQHLVHHLKYKGHQNIGALMGLQYAEILKSIKETNTVTDVVPVPLHPKKLRKRGYNQVAVFGKTIAEQLEVHYNDRILKRVTYTNTQTKKNREARAAIIGSAFDINFTESDEGKHFLLIDDVITTGATLEACGRALLTIPNTKLSIITIAYAHS